MAEYVLERKKKDRFLVKDGDITIGRDGNVMRELIIAHEEGCPVGVQSFECALIGDNSPWDLGYQIQVDGRSWVEAVGFDILCFDVFGEIVQVLQFNKIIGLGAA